MHVAPKDMTMAQLVTAQSRAIHLQQLQLRYYL
jgi:hypothetical protein